MWMNFVDNIDQLRSILRTGQHETPDRVGGLERGATSLAFPEWNIQGDIVKISAKNPPWEPASSGTRSRAEKSGTPRIHENPRPVGHKPGHGEQRRNGRPGAALRTYRETRCQTARTSHRNGGRVPATPSVSGSDMTHKWHEIADVLAAAMSHSENGVCTLTDNEHAALAAYVEARRPGRAVTRSYLGLTGGLDAFNHSHHAPDPQFVVEGES